MPEAAYGTSTRWLSCMLIDPKLFGLDREQIRFHLQAEQIETRPVWKPLHLQPVFDCCKIYWWGSCRRIISSWIMFTFWF